MHEIERIVDVREPFAADALLEFLAIHAVPGVESVSEGCYARTVRLPHGPAVLRVGLADTRAGSVPCPLSLSDPGDAAVAVQRVRDLLDADADPAVVDAALGADPLLGTLVAACPGLRVPGGVDGFEIAARTVLGQQVTVTGGVTLAARLVAAYGDPLPTSHGLTHLFPTPEAVAAVDVETLAMPRSRGRALTGLAAAVVAGDVLLDGTGDRHEVRARLLALPGIGPWTADYVAMRALGEPDAFLPTDVGVRRAAAMLGLGLDHVLLASAGWRPWRSYALMHLWQVLFAAGAVGGRA